VLTVFPASSLPACYATSCAPCYVTARPYEMTFPEFLGIQGETYTFDVIPHVTQLPNGTASTRYETLGMNASSVMDVELRHEYTWTENGMTL
jgi:nitric oxide synthase oxygenase domain/subunit